MPLFELFNTHVHNPALFFGVFRQFKPSVPVLNIGHIDAVANVGQVLDNLFAWRFFFGFRRFFNMLVGLLHNCAS
jgi:hypothetical protein